jgi:hypothetical protein
VRGHLQFAVAGIHGQALRDEEVAGVAAAYILHTAGLAELLNILAKNYLHWFTFQI